MDDDFSIKIFINHGKYLPEGAVIIESLVWIKMSIEKNGFIYEKIRLKNLQSYQCWIVGLAELNLGVKSHLIVCLSDLQTFTASISGFLDGAGLSGVQNPILFVKFPDFYSVHLRILRWCWIIQTVFQANFDDTVKNANKKCRSTECTSILHWIFLLILVQNIKDKAFIVIEVDSWGKVFINRSKEQPQIINKAIWITTLLDYLYQIHWMLLKK